jgi:ABC-2 type transport system permease protein
MNTQSNAVPESFESSRTASVVISSTRPMYWSVRRELWENRSIYVAPLTVASVALFAFTLSSIVGIWEKPLRIIPETPQAPYDMAAGLMMLTSILVSVFYCLDALHGERRDRSILFWKSLPVSDLTTVLAKASIPLVVLPLFTFAITVAMQWLMLLVSSAVLLVSGQSVVAFWTKLSFLRMSLLLLYHLLTAHALWPFPVYCWLLLVSGWARRATFLWAALPLIALAGVEQIVFHTWHFARLVGSRLIGDTQTIAAGGMFPTGPMTHITPGIFLTSPGLWIGFAIAVAFLAVAVRLRRYQGPI